MSVNVYRRYEDIRRVVGQIDSLRMQQIELPPFLFPTEDLEGKYIWLKDLEKMPKISKEGTVDDIIVNMGGQPQLLGFKISKQNTFPLTPFIILILWIMYISVSMEWDYGAWF